MRRMVEVVGLEIVRLVLMLMLMLMRMRMLT